MWPGTRSTISRSISVALSANLPASARSKTLDNIGIVVRRSTTLWTWLSALRKAAGSMVRFMLATQVLRGPAPAGPPGQPLEAGQCPRRVIPATGRHHSTNQDQPQHPLWRLTLFGRSALQHPAQQLNVLGQRRIGTLQLLDLAHGMHDGGVVAATEFPSDFRH